jgi:predicted O-methyltransferase YrrM
MSNRTLSLDDRLHAYLLDVGVDEPDLLRELREETFASIDFPAMQISPEQGQFMSLLLRLFGARRAIELGTYTGYSSICIARALPADGELVCCDIERRWTAIAERYWRRAGLRERIDLRLKPALETLEDLLASGRGGEFDFVFIDADKLNYDAYYELALRLLRSGGLVAIDNTLWSGDVANPANTEPGTCAIRRLNELLKDDARVERCLLPIGDGLSLALKR